MKILLMLLVLAASGCSLILASGEEEIDIGSGPIPAPIDAALADTTPEDAAPEDAPPDADPEPLCDQYTDDGCEGGDVCKGGVCSVPLGDEPEGAACGSSLQCEVGTGCNNTCMRYCDDDNPCHERAANGNYGGGCYQGFCFVI